MKYYGDLELIEGVFSNAKLNDYSNSTPTVGDYHGIIFFDYNDNKIGFFDDQDNKIYLENYNNTTLKNLFGEVANSNLTFNPTPINNLSEFSGFTGNSTITDIFSSINSELESIKNNISNISSFPTSPEDGDFIVYENSQYVSYNISEYFDNFSDLDMTIGSIEEFSDIDVNIDNSYVFFDSNSGTFKNQKLSFTGVNLISQSQHNFTHNLNQRICHVTVVNGQSYEKINDAEITYTGNNSLTVNLSSPAPVRVLISKI